MLRFLKTTSLLWLMIAAILLGFFVPSLVAWLGEWTPWLLGAIFFLSALVFRPTSWQGHRRLGMELGGFIAGTLVLLPAAVWLLFAPIVSAPVLVALVLLSSMPAGLTSPAIVAGGKGNMGLALWLTVASSLVAPLSVPLVLQMTVGQAVVVPFWLMALDLVLFIMVPFGLAQGLRWLWPKAAQRLERGAPLGTRVLLFLLIAGIVARYLGGETPLLLAADTWVGLGLVTALFGVLHGVMHLFKRVAPTKEWVSLVTCLVYTNFTLAIALGAEFFPDPETMLILTLATLPWAIGAGIWQAKASRVR